MTFTVTHHTNPVPYKRTTQRAKFVSKDYARYKEWKNKIYVAFIGAFKKPPHKILKNDTKYYVDVMVYYKDKKHGDTDNIGKGVNDAIFQKPLSDKYVAGSFDFDYDKNNPRVEIKIIEGDM